MSCPLWINDNFSPVLQLSSYPLSLKVPVLRCSSSLSLSCFDTSLFLASPSRRLAAVAALSPRANELTLCLTRLDHSTSQAAGANSTAEGSRKGQERSHPHIFGLLLALVLVESCTKSTQPQLCLSPSRDPPLSSCKYPRVCSASVPGVYLEVRKYIGQIRQLILP